MPRQTPEVVTGMRPPRTVVMENIAAKSAQAADPLVRNAPVRIESETGTVYESQYVRYRVQITSPADEVDPKTGRRISGRPIAVQFEDFRYVNDPREFGKPNDKLRAFIDEALQSNPRYGLGNHFWLAKDQEAVDQSKALEGARNTLRSVPPEMARQIIAEMAASGELDLALPPRTDKHKVEIPPEV